MATFILVHGTWAKLAHWPSLQNGLAKVAHAAGEVPLFEHITWTGRNRARARQSAASAILTLIQRIQSTSTNEKIFIIGHSHGGSAVAYFLKEHPEVASTLAGCAFLSTPFVAIRPRRNAFWLLACLLSLPYIFLINIVPPPYYNISILERERLGLPYWSSAHWVYLFIIGVGVAIVCLALPSIKRASDPHKVEQSVRQQTADIPAGNYLFLRCSGDEAAAALSAFQFTAWLGMKGARLLELVTRPFHVAKFSKRSFALGVVLTTIAGLITFGWLNIVKHGLFRYFFSPDGPFVEKLGTVQRLWERGSAAFAHTSATVIDYYIAMFGYMTGIAYDLAALVVLCLVVMCLVTVLLIFTTQAVSSWAFGWTRLSTGFVVELAIEPLPFGQHSLTHIDWGAGSIALDGMVHSWTYAHPTAIEHLQKWVRVSLAKSHDRRAPD